MTTRPALSSILLPFLCGLIVLIPTLGYGYPLDGTSHTGIGRLEGYLYSLRTNSAKEAVVPGALLGTKDVIPRLPANKTPRVVRDTEASKELKRLLGPDAAHISVSVYDISDPRIVRSFGLHEEQTFLPGSVGKIAVALAVFNELAKLYPYDEGARLRVLRDSIVVADEFILSDEHEVPFWIKASGKEKEVTEGRIELRPLELGDKGNLFTFLDWMLSASSNAAASIVMQQLVLLRAFGSAYPPSEQEKYEFFQATSPARAGALLSASVQEAVRRVGLNPQFFFHASPFTKEAKKRIASRGSVARTKDLVEFLLRIESGALVDEFTSRELKRLLYLTQSRFRYSAAPELDFAAVYFKSGSLYSCMPERNYNCEKFRGNRKNILNAVALVEQPSSTKKARYLVAVHSNVLRKDSIELHQKIARIIQDMILAKHPDAVVRPLPPSPSKVNEATPPAVKAQ